VASARAYVWVGVGRLWNIVFRFILLLVAPACQKLLYQSVCTAFNISSCGKQNHIPANSLNLKSLFREFLRNSWGIPGEFQGNAQPSQPSILILGYKLLLGGSMDKSGGSGGGNTTKGNAATSQRKQSRGARIYA
jgi:hypothetical protein